MRRKTVLKAALAAASGAALIPLTACAAIADATSSATNARREPSSSVKSDLEALAGILDGDNPVTWVCTGDSITQGAKFTNGWRHYVEHFEERVRWELGRKWDFVVNTGVSSERSSHIVADFENRVTRFSPAVVTLMVGTNDCVSGVGGRESFRQNINQLVDQVRDLDAIPVVQTFNPVGHDGDVTREDMPAYAQIIRDVAKEKHVILVDHYSKWESSGKSSYNKWLGDPIHPNEVGHLKLALELFDGLKIMDPDGQTASLKFN